MHGARRHKWWMALVLSCCAVALRAQQPTVTLTCNEKLVQVGRPFEVELSVRHPERMIVVFPDTATEFKPYEVESGQPVPTRTDEGTSEDTKRYRLYTWEIDSLQRLQFPVHYLTEKGDTQTVMSNEVVVEFQPVLQAYSDTLKTKSIGELAVIREPINWLAWAIVITVSLLILVVLAVVLYKPIWKMLRRAKIEREWRKNQAQLQALRGLTSDQAAYYSGLNKVWRHYLDRGSRLALPARTSAELEWILEELQTLDENDQAVLLRLSQVNDIVLYAGRQQPEEQGPQFWNAVQAIMQKEYLRRKEALEL